MDREKVIQGLEQIVNDPFMKARADYWVLVCFEAIAMLKDAPEWISCKEREPEEYELVIVLIYGHDVIIQQDGETLEEAIRRTMNKCRTSCGYLGGDGWCDSEGYPMIIRPSYWMKIPDPPERRFE